MSSLLPLTLRSRIHEPAHAALCRLASRVGALDARRFARCNGFAVSKLVTGRDVYEFASRAGLEPEAVVGSSPVIAASSRLVTLSGQTLKLGDWSLRSRRHCPLCLDYDRVRAGQLELPVEWWATSRAWWDIRSIDACPVHGVSLTDLCTACGAVQSWQQNLLACYACGAILAGRPGNSARTGVSAYIVGRLGFGPEHPIPVLDALRLDEAIKAMELLGATRLSWSLNKPPRSEGQMVEDRVFGLAMTAEWPKYLHAHLDRLSQSRGFRAPDGLIAAYGWLYSHLCVGDVPPSISALVAPIIREHAVRNCVMARDEDRLRDDAPTTLSVWASAKLLGRSFATTRRLLEEADAIPEGSRRGVAFALDPSTITLLAAGKRPAPSARCLRIGRNQARTLLHDENIRAAVAPNLPDPALVLLDSLESRAITSLVDHGVSLPLACRNMSVPLATACTAILGGLVTIARCGTKDKGLHAFMVNQNDLAALRSRADFVGVEALARRGAIHPDTARHLVRSGAFGRRDAGGKVCRLAADRFFEQHVTAAQLAQQHGTSSATIRSALKGLGIEPAFAPPACRQIIFRKADLPSLS